jgi:hypothetical protein
MIGSVIDNSLLSFPTLSQIISLTESVGAIESVFTQIVLISRLEFCWINDGVMCCWRGICISFLYRAVVKVKGFELYVHFLLCFLQFCYFVLKMIDFPINLLGLFDIWSPIR